MSWRDPRVDPRAGDILRVNGAAVEIYSCDAIGIVTPEVTFRREGDPVNFLALPTFRRWVKGAEIVKVAP